jgi:hypothetical protein
LPVGECIPHLSCRNTQYSQERDQRPWRAIILSELLGRIPVLEKTVSLYSYIHDTLSNLEISSEPPQSSSHVHGKQASKLTDRNYRSNTSNRKIHQHQQIPIRSPTHPLPPLRLPPKPRRLDALSNPLRKPKFHTPTRRRHRYFPRTSLGCIQNILIKLAKFLRRP